MKTMGTRGMVASPHYLATGAGLNVLRRGGSAIDAAIATNAVLSVVTPYMCGLGGDLFALTYAPGGSVRGLNSSGRAPAEATVERVRELAGGDRMPARGPLPITVPGAVDGWGQLHAAGGRLPWADLFADAIEYAERGFPVTSEFSESVARSAPFLHPDTPARETYLPGGRAPREGEIFTQPRLARTLHTLAHEGPDAYYLGEIGREIARAVRAVGGLLSEDDLRRHEAIWVEPLSVRFRDVTVYEMPPNSQGIVALLMLNMLEQLPQEPMRAGGEEYAHTLAEVGRLAYADREAYITDPEHMRVETGAILSPEYAKSRVREIGARAAQTVPAGTPGDTIYLCTADADGNLVSLIESNYMGIGSGVMGGQTGIMLQNRGAWFSLQPDHANVIAPRKRTMHTLMPAMAFRDESPYLVFGTMGGSMQAQIHAQLLSRLLDAGMEPDEALAAPRLEAAPLGVEGAMVTLERGFDPEVAEGLRRRGYEVEEVEPGGGMGHAHMIEIRNGAYVGASDPRTFSLALGY